jgi:hypothetical protein
VEQKTDTTIPDIKKRRLRLTFFENNAIINNTSIHKTGYNKKNSTFDSIKYILEILIALLLYFTKMKYNSTLPMQYRELPHESDD